MHRGSDASDSTFLVFRMDTKDVPFEARFMCNLLGAGTNRRDHVLDAVRVLVDAAAFGVLVRAFWPVRRPLDALLGPRPRAGATIVFDAVAACCGVQSWRRGAGAPLPVSGVVVLASWTLARVA